MKTRMLCCAHPSSLGWRRRIPPPLVLLLLVSLSVVAQAQSADTGETVELQARALDENKAVSASASEPISAAVATSVPASERLGLDLSVKLDAFITQGRTFAVDVSADNSDGIHGLNWALELGAAYLLPLPQPWRLVSLQAFFGYTPFIGQGLASYTQWQSVDGSVVATEQSYRYDWSIHMIPINAGLRIALPLQAMDISLPIDIETEFGFAGGLAWAASTLTLEGADTAFAENARSFGFGLGYYLGAGVSYPLPPELGCLVASYRYSAVKLDFDHPDFNATWGDLGGHHVLVGYRFKF